MLDKKKENSQFVWYLFYMDATGEEYIDSRGSKRFHIVEKQGICLFNKEEGYFVIDWNKTDKYFLDKLHEISHIKRKLTECKRLHFFPEIIDIATG